jgi:uncharacterized membrane protein YkvA (DUF1232 family)
MGSFFSVIQTLILVGGLLGGLFLVLLSMPESKLREAMMPVVCWCLAIACGVYVISPLDIVPEAFFGPFGLIDDIGAVVAGIAATRAAINAAKARKQSVFKAASRSSPHANGAARVSLLEDKRRPAG